MAHAAAAPTIRDPFAVIPMKPDAVEMKTDSAGHVHLRLHAAPKGFGATVARWLGYDYTRKLELDDMGSAFYRQVDGVTTLNAIVDAMAAHLDRPRGEAEQLVVLFTKKLMVMNMLALIVPEETSHA
jgi:hypothetical protein